MNFLIQSLIYCWILALWASSYAMALSISTSDNLLRFTLLSIPYEYVAMAKGRLFSFYLIVIDAGDYLIDL